MLANRSPFVSRRSISRLAPPVAVLALLLTGACVPAPPPAPAPPPPGPAPTLRPLVTPRRGLPAPAPTADWRDMAQTAGTWKWGMDGETSVARFGEAGDEPLATLTCDPLNRVVTLRLTGRAAQIPGSAAPAPAETSVIVTTTGARQMFTAATDIAGGGSVSFAPRDPILDAIAFSRGRFMLEISGISTLYLPSWPELSRVIEDCRQEVVHRPEAGRKP